MKIDNQNMLLNWILLFSLFHMLYGNLQYSSDSNLHHDLFSTNINLLLFMDAFHLSQYENQTIINNNQLNDTIYDLSIESIEDFDPEIKFNDEVILNPSNIININISTSVLSNNSFVLDHKNLSIFNETIITTIDDKIIPKIKKMKDLFKSFSWKGIGICLRKSVISWNGFGVSIRLPVTVNFPEYDNIVYYPRISCFLGVGYPYSLYFTTSMSLPTQTIMIPFLLFRDTKNKHDSMQTLINKMTADSVRRYGVSCSIKYSKSHGYHFSIGPTLSYIPGHKFLDILKRTVLFIPNILITCYRDIRVYLHILLKKMISFLQSNIVKKKIIISKKESYQINSYNENHIYTNNSNILNTKNDITIAFSNIIKDKHIKTSQNHWTRMIRWIQTKSPRLAYNIGGFYSNKHNNGMGSNLIIELQPFYPLYKILLRFKKSNFYQYYYEYNNKYINKLYEKETLIQSKTK